MISMITRRISLSRQGPWLNALQMYLPETFPLIASGDNPSLMRSIARPLSLHPSATGKVSVFFLCFFVFFCVFFWGDEVKRRTQRLSLR